MPKVWMGQFWAFDSPNAEKTREGHNAPPSPPPTPTTRKVFNSFQTRLNHIQGCVGCQIKGKTSINMNLVVFCAKIQLELKNLKKCGKDKKIPIFFLRFFILSLNVV